SKGLAAIKFIRADLFDNDPVLRDEAVARFTADLQVQAAVRHPGVVPVIDAGEEAGRPYYVMQFVPGRTLARALADGPKPYKIAARLAVDLADAMAAAHAHGVIHRDVKPQNILLTLDDRPLLADFGLAKLLPFQTSRA